MNFSSEMHENKKQGRFLTFIFYHFCKKSETLTDWGIYKQFFERIASTSHAALDILILYLD